MRRSSAPRRKAERRSLGGRQGLEQAAGVGTPVAAILAAREGLERLAGALGLAEPIQRDASVVAGLDLPAVAGLGLGEVSVPEREGLGVVGPHEVGLVRLAIQRVGV